jgi:hypothetical protein
MAKAKGATEEDRKQRTRTHVIASISVNYVERFICEKGHTAERVANDYGYDLIMYTYDKEGFIENGLAFLQLKATDELLKTRDGNFVRFEISAKDYNLWIAEGYPVFLIVYDSINKCAYWLYIQSYFKRNPRRKPGTKKTTTVRIPIGNEFSDVTVDYIRERKAAAHEQVLNKVSHDD